VLATHFADEREEMFGTHFLPAIFLSTLLSLHPINPLRWIKIAAKRRENRKSFNHVLRLASKLLD
jgi:hypothetical protein